MGKIAGIDFGTRNIGIALSDESHQFAERFTTVKSLKNRSLAEQVAKALQDQEIELVILGLPVGLENKPTKISQQTEEFGAELEKLMGTEIKYWNETYSSQQAEANLRNQEKIHMEAARIILQAYLDFNSSGI